MTVQNIPVRPNLEFYRKQARALLKSVQSDDPAAIRRVRTHLPRYSSGSRFLLSDAQWVLARENGAANWPKFRQELEARAAVPDPSAPDELPVAALTESTTAVSGRPSGGTIGDEAVKARTGKDWSEWFQILDAAGAATMTHQQIVGVVSEQHGIGPWWRQMVAVNYERARGLRVKNQGCSGNFQVSVSKTLGMSAERAFEAWTDPTRRAVWLAGAELTIRKATPHKSVRITWRDGSSVDVGIFPKGESRCRCAVEHAKLAGPDDIEPARAYWQSALERLKALSEP